MKRLFSVAVLAFALLMNASQSKAQTAAPMGQGMIRYADYKGARYTFQCFARNSWDVFWTAMSIIGPGSGSYDEPKVVLGKLRLPAGCLLYDENGNVVPYQEEVITP